MAVNRVAGLVLPLSTKYFFDNILHGNGSKLAALRDRGVYGDGDPGGDFVFADAAALEGSAAADRRHAQAGAAAYRAALGELLRREPQRHAGVADHDATSRACAT